MAELISINSPLLNSNEKTKPLLERVTHANFKIRIEGGVVFNFT